MLIKICGDKVNFIDSNDVFVGYDLGQDCCEHADWYVTSVRNENAYKNNDYDYLSGVQDGINVTGFVFDQTFVEAPDFGDGGMVIFRLTKGDEEIFLHLFNSHNGYYGHGFETTLPCVDDGGWTL